jgi:hypothetical protein
LIHGAAPGLTAADDFPACAVAVPAQPIEDIKVAPKAPSLRLVSRAIVPPVAARVATDFAANATAAVVLVMHGECIRKPLRHKAEPQPQDEA